MIASVQPWLALVVLVLLQSSSYRSAEIPRSSTPVSNSNVARRGEIPATSGTDRRPLPNGIWGGQGISLEITDGGVEINFDCAHGRIQGKKEAVGTFTLKRGNNGQVGKCM